MDTTVRDFYVQKERLELFAKEEFENQFEYVGDACYVKHDEKRETAFKAYTNGGIKPECEKFPSMPDNPEETVDQYIAYINSLDIKRKNVLLWRDRPILDCFEDDELGQVCTVYSRFALLKGV